MLPYFLIWAWIGWFSLSGRQRWGLLTIIGVWLFLVLLIGLRVEIGADWGTYLAHLYNQIDKPLSYPILSKEPGYALANWISIRLDWDIFGVNLICSAFFSAGLVSYCRKQPYPWLALALAFPYLTIVVAMGYSRQGVAIGLELFGLMALERERFLQFIGWIFLASTFHASSLIMLVLPLATVRRDFVRWTGLLRLLLLAGASYGLFEAILFSGSLDFYVTNYLEAQYQSEGALIRVLLCLLPGLIFLWKRHEFPITAMQRSIYSLMSFMAVAAAIGLTISSSSTAVDRISLHLIPLQIFVGSYIPLIRLLGLSAALSRLLLILLSFFVMSVWLFFANYSFAWIPYRNLLLEF